MPTPSRVKNLAKRALFQVHKVGLRAGVQILPNHFYSPVPDLRWLKQTRNTWARKSEMPGVATDLEDQVGLLRRVCLPYREEYEGNTVYQDAVEHKAGSGYGYVEAQALHGVIRHFNPRRVIEVGSGVSSYCIAAALDRNAEETGQRARMTCIEPYPADHLRALPSVELREQPVQEVPVSIFEELDAGDLLFIDSSHAVKTGSDVNFVVLEVLPRLRPGVVVQVHDIYFPYDYSPDVLQTLFHWNETALYHAYLVHNDRVRILFCLSQLHHERPDALRRSSPSIDRCPRRTASSRRALVRTSKGTSPLRCTSRPHPSLGLPAPTRPASPRPAPVQPPPGRRRRVRTLRIPRPRTPRVPHRPLPPPPASLSRGL